MNSHRIVTLVGIEDNGCILTFEAIPNILKARNNPEIGAFGIYTKGPS